MELYHTVYKCKQGVILANTYILSGIVLGATLANDDVAGNTLLATPDLNS